MVEKEKQVRIQNLLKEKNKMMRMMLKKEKRRKLMNLESVHGEAVLISHKPVLLTWVLEGSIAPLPVARKDFKKIFTFSKICFTLSHGPC